MLTAASMSSFGRTYSLRPKLARASLSGSRRFACGGRAVGEKDDLGRPAAFGEHVERAAECGVDVLAAAGVESVDEADGAGARVVRKLLQFRLESFDRAVVGDDVEQVAPAEVVEHE